MEVREPGTKQPDKVGIQITDRHTRKAVLHGRDRREEKEAKTQKVTGKACWASLRALSKENNRRKHRKVRNLAQT